MDQCILVFRAGTQKLLSRLQLWDCIDCFIGLFAYAAFSR